MGHGRCIINIEDKNVQLKVYREIIKKELSVRKTETLVRKVKENKTPKKNLKIAMNFIEEEKYISKLIGSKVQIISSGDNKGVLKIHFNSKSELLKLKKIFKK